MGERTMTTTATYKWYNRTWLVLTLSLLIFPFGLYGLWKNRRLHMALKVAVSVLSPVTTLIIGAVLYYLVTIWFYEADIYFDAGTEKYDLKDYKGAIAAYDTAILKKPTYAAAYLMRGNSYDELKDKQKALIDYTLAIQFDSSYAAAYLNRGLIKSELSNYKDAIDDFDKAIKFDSLNAKAFYFRGLNKQAIGRQTEACKDFRAALKLGRTDAADELKRFCY